MDILDFLVYLMVFYTVVLIPLAYVLWEIVRPWAKALWRDWKAFRTERRVEKKRAEYYRSIGKENHKNGYPKQSPHFEA